MKKVYLMSKQEKKDIWIGEAWIAIVALGMIFKVLSKFL